MYHSVGGAQMSPDIVVSEAHFTSHIRYLCQRYRLLTLQKAVDLIEAGHPVPGNAVVVTLDDGYRDSYDTALPVLKRYACPSTLFVTVEPLDTGRRLWPQALWHWLHSTRETQLRLSWRSTTGSESVEKTLSLHGGADRARARAWIRAFAGGLDAEGRQAFLSLVARELGFCDAADTGAADVMLTWAQLRDMHDSGVTIGSHTMTHPRLSGLGPMGVRRELVDSRVRLERELDAPIPLFAYPFGNAPDFTESTKAAVRAAGYQAACVAEDATRAAPPDLLALPRLYVPDEPTWKFALRLVRASSDHPFIDWLLED